LQNKTQNEIKKRNELTLAYIELGSDPVFSKLSFPLQQKYIGEAIKVGEETARWLEDLYQTRDPRKIAQKLKINVRGEASKQGKKFIKSSSDFKNKEIIIYRNVIDKLLRVVDKPGFSDKILKILVALELFHYLEQTKVGVVYKQFEFPGLKLGPFESKKYIKGLSRVAAYAFVYNLLELELTSVNFDYLVYVLFTKQ